MQNVKVENSRVSPSTEANIGLKKATGIPYFRTLEPNWTQNIERIKAKDVDLSGEIIPELATSQC